MYHLSVYVPETHVEQVKEALFAAGAGRMGSYDQCCWQTQGTGQFRALKGSQPFIGKINQTGFVGESKLELVCEQEALKSTVEALKKSHPYETPAYFIVPIIDV